MSAPAKNRPDAREVVNRVLAELGETESPATAVCVAALVVGPNVRRISAVLELPLSEVSQYGRRLRGNGIWVGSKVCVEHPSGIPDPIEIAMWALTAEGMVEVFSAA